MSTIFEKIPVSGNCLILEPKESLIIPFDFGDWSELRLSVALSFTGPNNDNDRMIGEITPGATSPLSSMFIGLYSGDGSPPFSQDTRFVGFGNRTGVPISLFTGSPSYPGIGIGIATQSINSSAGGFPLISGFSCFDGKYTESGAGATTVSITPTGVNWFSLASGGSISNANFLATTGTIGFSKIISSKFAVESKNNTGQRFSLSFSHNGVSTVHTNTSIDVLKLANNNVSFAQSFGGLYYNSNLTPTGTAVTLPDKLLISFPFVSNRARIHSFLLEKYA
jgi:hypothetical protein